MPWVFSLLLPLLNVHPQCFHKLDICCIAVYTVDSVQLSIDSVLGRLAWASAGSWLSFLLVLPPSHHNLLTCVCQRWLPAPQLTACLVKRHFLGNFEAGLSHADRFWPGSGSDVCNLRAILLSCSCLVSMMVSYPRPMGKAITLGVTGIRWKAPRSQTALHRQAVMAAQTAKEVNLMLYLSQLLFGGLPAAVVKLISKQMHWAFKFFTKNLEWIPWN